MQCRKPGTVLWFPGTGNTFDTGTIQIIALDGVTVACCCGLCKEALLQKLSCAPGTGTSYEHSVPDLEWCPDAHVCALTNILAKLALADILARVSDVIWLRSALLTQLGAIMVGPWYGDGSRPAKPSALGCIGRMKSIRA
jgi:hypothetical protein